MALLDTPLVIRGALLALLAAPLAIAAVPQDVRETAGDVLLTPPETVWTSLNMGSGTGLDADSLDGVDSSAFFDADDVLEAAIAAEAAARAGMDDGLATRIALEQAARAAADASLAARIPTVHYVANTQSGTAACDDTRHSLGNAALSITTAGPALVEVSGTGVLRVNAGHARVYVALNGVDSFSPALTTLAGNFFQTLNTERVVSVPAGTHLVSLGYQCGLGSSMSWDNAGGLIARVYPQ